MIRKLISSLGANKNYKSLVLSSMMCNLVYKQAMEARRDKSSAHTSKTSILCVQPAASEHHNPIATVCGQQDTSIAPPSPPLAACHPPSFLSPRRVFVQPSIAPRKRYWYVRHKYKKKKRVPYHGSYSYIRMRLPNRLLLLLLLPSLLFLPLVGRGS